MSAIYTTVTITADAGTPLTLGMLREAVARTAEMSDAAEVMNPRDGNEIGALEVRGEMVTMRSCTADDDDGEPLAGSWWLAMQRGAYTRGPYVSRDPAADARLAPFFTAAPPPAPWPVEPTIYVCAFDGRLWPCFYSDEPGHEAVPHDPTRYVAGKDHANTWWVVGPHGREAWRMPTRGVAVRTVSEANEGGRLPTTRRPAEDPPPEIVQWAQPVEGGA